MNLLVNKKQRISYLGKLIISLNLALFTLASFATTLKISDSVGLPKNEKRDKLRSNFLKKEINISFTEHLLSKGTNLNRSEVIGHQNQQRLNQKSINSSDHEFTIFDAHSHLLGDQDNDGYYQKFSVTFDADHDSSGWEVVYAKLYLSNDNGNTWIHYYTTDDFIIDSDHSYDDYEVVTTLHTGYPADHYDVLIDLYEDGHHKDIVATYSSYDSTALAELPLESKNHDIKSNKPTSKSSGKGGGSYTFMSLFFILIIRYLRCFINTQRNEFQLK